MDAIDALWMGILQGLTEYLPVSSSGHLAIASHFSGIDGEQNLAFTVTVHVATVFSTLVILWKEIVWIFKGLFDFKTPGREDDADEASTGAESSGSTQTNELIPQIVEAVGGKANIKSVDACFTRLRLKLNDASLVKEDPYFKESLGASAIVHVGDGVQIVYGNKASVYKSEMREYLGME